MKPVNKIFAFLAILSLYLAVTLAFSPILGNENINILENETKNYHGETMEFKAEPYKLFIKDDVGKEHLLETYNATGIIRAKEFDKLDMKGIQFIKQYNKIQKDVKFLEAEEKQEKELNPVTSNSKSGEVSKIEVKLPDEKTLNLYEQIESFKAQTNEIRYEYCAKGIKEFDKHVDLLDSIPGEHLESFMSALKTALVGGRISYPSEMPVDETEKKSEKGSVTNV